MLDLGFRCHDMGTYKSQEDLARDVASYRTPSCLHLAPYKALKENTPKPMTEEWAAETKSIFDRYSTRVAILGCYINPALLDEDALEIELRKFENGIDVAKALGNPIVATETGSVDPKNIYHEDTWKEENFTRFLKNIERLLNYAEKKNVTIAVEAVANKNTLDTPERMFRCLDTFRSPRLRCLFDAVNIMPIYRVDDLVGWYDETISMLSPYISIMHLKDYKWVDYNKEYPYAKGTVKYGYVPSGEGLFPWKEVFALYRKYGVINVPMTMENYRPETLRASISYLEEAAGEA